MFRAFFRYALALRALTVTAALIFGPPEFLRAAFHSIIHDANNHESQAKQYAGYDDDAGERPLCKSVARIQYAVENRTSFFPLPFFLARFL